MAPPRKLPILAFGKRKYYFDLKLWQLRKVDDPNDFIDLSDLEAVVMLFRNPADENESPESVI